MAAVTGLTLIKRFHYRGNWEEWGNTYHFDGDVPADPTEWLVLSNNLIAGERECYPSSVEIIRAYGYDNDDLSPTAVWTYDYLDAGESVLGAHVPSGNPMPGDAAGLVYWKTDRLVNGKHIYLRKYFHAPDTVDGAPDTIQATLKTAYEEFALLLSSGSFDDSRHIRSRTHADNIIAQGARPYVTTRTLKRRGKRPGA